MFHVLVHEGITFMCMAEEVGGGRGGPGRGGRGPSGVAGGRRGEGLQQGEQRLAGSRPEGAEQQQCRAGNASDLMGVRKRCRPLLE